MPPSSLYATRSGRGAKGWGRDLVLSSLMVLLLRGPTSPSLTLASAPPARGHRGRPIPARRWLPCGWDGTGAPGDTAAQGRGLGPQLGARWRRSPSTCRPVLDTVYASFWGIQDQGAPERLQQHAENAPAMTSSSADAAATMPLCRHGSQTGGWVAESECGCFQALWPLGVRCWARSRRVLCCCFLSDFLSWMLNSLI